MLTFAFGEKIAEPCALVLGGFDGLHLGHRALLAVAKKYGLPVAVTTIFGGKGKALFTRAEREFLFARAGVDFVCEIAFTEQFENTSAEDFLATLLENIHARILICGEDFRFGRGVLGTAELLKRHVPNVLVQKTVKYFAEESGGMRKFSTTACKAALKAGDLPRLNASLETRDFFGSTYFLQGEVEHGRKVGRTYGFPTLNLTPPPEKLLPPDGVYGGLCATPQGNFPTILNIGARPTFGVGERKIEAYLDGFSGDLYGQTVRIYPIEFYRPIEKFQSAEALKTQLQKDISRLQKASPIYGGGSAVGGGGG